MGLVIIMTGFTNSDKIPNSFASSESKACALTVRTVRIQIFQALKFHSHSLGYGVNGLSFSYHDTMIVGRSFIVFFLKIDFLPRSYLMVGIDIVKSQQVFCLHSKFFCDVGISIAGTCYDIV